LPPETRGVAEKQVVGDCGIREPTDLPMSFQFRSGQSGASHRAGLDLCEGDFLIAPILFFIFVTKG
jgi:hypothetical protein